MKADDKEHGFLLHRRVKKEIYMKAGTRGKRGKKAEARGSRVKRRHISFQENGGQGGSGSESPWHFDLTESLSRFPLLVYSDIHPTLATLAA